MSYHSLPKKDVGRRQKRPFRLIFARGNDIQKMYTMPKWVLFGGGALLVVLCSWYLAATAYLIFRDDMLAATMSRYTRMQSAYEDRITALRLQVDRVTSRQLIDQELFLAKINTLLEQQDELNERARIVEDVLAGGDGSRLENVASRQSGFKPYKVYKQVGNIGTKLEKIEKDISAIKISQVDSLEKFEEQARRRETKYRKALSIVGLESASIFDDHISTASAVGGPFIPADLSPAEFKERLSVIKKARSHVVALEKKAYSLPIRRPVRGSFDVTSTFGGRSDPFNRGRAFHAGIDLRGDTGRPIYAPASGRVLRAGRYGGYGNFVEIDHGYGRTTRYGHLHRIHVSQGQYVTAGNKIGEIGSTGRSTGPHLHYETRVNGQAVDPMSYVKAGMQLGLF